jgi:hypothetical protein
MTSYVLSSHLSDPAAARGQAIVALGQTIEKQAFTVSYSSAFAALGAMLILAICFILLFRSSKQERAEQGRRIGSQNVFDGSPRAERFRRIAARHRPHIGICLKESDYATGYPPDRASGSAGSRDHRLCLRHFVARG